jgi:hypothetical protein
LATANGNVPGDSDGNVLLSALAAKYDVGCPLTGASMSRPTRAILALLAVGAVLAGIVWATFQLPAFGGRPGPIVLERIRASKQFHGGHFENTPPYVSNLSFWGELKSYLGHEVREPQFEVRMERIGPRDLARPVPSGLRARWLGHATVLLEIDGLRVLTDPVLSQRASPFGFIGPAR